MSEATPMIPPRSQRLAHARQLVLVGTIVCLALLVLGIFLEPHRWFQAVGPRGPEHEPTGGLAQFFRSWLFAWFFWWGVSLGSMGLIMMHYLLGGGWGYLIRRFGEAASLCIPVLAVLFIPVILGVKFLYPWAVPEQVAHDGVLQHKAHYLNFIVWVLRAFGYFIVFSWMAWRLRVWSISLDREFTPRKLKNLVNLSAIGEVIYFVLMALAGVDWVMSREPHWISTVFGFIVVMAQAISGMCFLILMVKWYGDEPPLKDVADPKFINDLGSVLVTFVILWAYMSFGQFLIIWLGNSQDEISWYVARTDGGWRWVGAALIALHFLIPFILLLMRPIKKKLGRLAAVAGALLFMRAIEGLYWVTASDAHDPGYWGASNWVYAEIMNTIAWLAIGGLWFLAFLWFLKDAPILPVGDRIPVIPVDHGHGQRPLPATVE
jgi:hypothetical protein